MVHKRISLKKQKNKLRYLKSKKGRYQNCKSLNFIRKDKIFLGINDIRYIR